eukprot:6208519-Pleurochrysis_carterae.AAC.1
MTTTNTATMTITTIITTTPLSPPPATITITTTTTTTTSTTTTKTTSKRLRLLLPAQTLNLILLTASEAIDLRLQLKQSVRRQIARATRRAGRCLGRRSSKGEGSVQAAMECALAAPCGRAFLRSTLECPWRHWSARGLSVGSESSCRRLRKRGMAHVAAARGALAHRFADACARRDEGFRRSTLRSMSTCAVPPRSPYFHPFAPLPSARAFASAAASEPASAPDFRLHLRSRLRRHAR